MSEEQARAAEPEWYKVEDVCARLNVSRSTLFNYIRNGRLPQPVRFSARNTRWHAEDIRDILRWGPGRAGTYLQPEPNALDVAALRAITADLPPAVSAEPVSAPLTDLVVELVDDVPDQLAAQPPTISQLIEQGADDQAIEAAVKAALAAPIAAEVLATATTEVPRSRKPRTARKKDKPVDVPAQLEPESREQKKSSKRGARTRAEPQQQADDQVVDVAGNKQPGPAQQVPGEIPAEIAFDFCKLHAGARPARPRRKKLSPEELRASDEDARRREEEYLADLQRRASAIEPAPAPESQSKPLGELTPAELKEVCKKADARVRERKPRGRPRKKS